MPLPLRLPPPPLPAPSVIIHDDCSTIPDSGHWRAFVVWMDYVLVYSVSLLHLGIFRSLSLSAKNQRKEKGKLEKSYYSIRLFLSLSLHFMLSFLLIDPFVFNKYFSSRSTIPHSLFLPLLVSALTFRGRPSRCWCFIHYTKMQLCVIHIFHFAIFTHTKVRITNPSIRSLSIFVRSDSTSDTHLFVLALLDFCSLH